ncbi:PREDICTED: testis-expressed sequence 2 protein [Vollenhovia emeryi]|uniref:testis-expressed sequence 2 protein n=1 Tax=Vollenhovia emeryi TaxID=411798 RepID=UPI0005F54815|nr:PREDICTED: testis-expressed sequence 2 protein [Vollenhovia emeryi]
MGSKYSPGKITLGMIKGKPIATSVPVIHYRANDDELDELYPSSSDDERRLTPESDRRLPSSPSKSSENGQGLENDAERRSIDDNASEGTPPSSDPWRVLSEIKGKITKTFEEKLSEIKSDRKKRRRRKKDNSSVSDSEDLGDVTPTDENVNDRQEREPGLGRGKGNAARFVGFSQVRTGLKTKNSQDDSVESGVEAAEFPELVPEPLPYESQDDLRAEDKDSDAACRRGPGTFDQSDGCVQAKGVKFGALLSRVKDHVFQQLTRQLAALLILVLASCFLIPLPAHLAGFFIGVFVTVVVYKLVQRIREVLATPLGKEPVHVVVPVLEIPAAEEHAVQERFEGWLNELPYAYDPHNYHVARTKSVFFSLEGGVLRVMDTRMKVPKRAVWDEPKRKYKFTRKRVYNLIGAKVELLPEGLTRRRRWSKKYPVCITMDQGALVNSASLSDWTDLGKEYLEDEKKVQVEGANQEAEESTLGEETKSEDEDSRLEYFKDNEEDEFKVDEDEDDDDLSQSKSIRSIYEDCRDNEEAAKCKLYVFARADREKEDWFRRLTSAAFLSKKRHSLSSINDSCASAISAQPDATETKSPEASPEVTYSTYMSEYLNTDPEGSPRENDVLWVNCLLGRLLFDMHSCPETISLIQDKIQRKLSSIKLPYFMESFLVTEMVIGQDAPTIHKISKPTLDERGLWFDLNITYKGSVTMTVETKLNLMKLTRASSVLSDIVDEKSVPTRSPMFDSDVEDSPETSTEDEDIGNITSSIASKETTPIQSSGKKFLSMVDKLTANKYFRHATELSYIRRAMEGVSNTEIRFMVSVSGIEGCLLVNIPPPPSDRLWYGFKTVPKIALTVQPTLGERTVNIVYVSNWIENKLLREFEKLVVLPNMDDLVLPLCPNYPFTTT